MFVWHSSSWFNLFSSLDKSFVKHTLFLSLASCLLLTKISLDYSSISSLWTSSVSIVSVIPRLWQVVFAQKFSIESCVSISCPLLLSQLSLMNYSNAKTPRKPKLSTNPNLRYYLSRLLNELARNFTICFSNTNCHGSGSREEIHQLFKIASTICC